MHTHARLPPVAVARFALCLAALRAQTTATAMQHLSRRLFSMSARLGAGAAEVAAAKRSLAADGIQVLGRVTDEFADVLTPAAVRFVARLQRRFNSTRLALLQRRVGQQMLADAGRPLSFPKACISFLIPCSPPLHAPCLNAAAHISLCSVASAVPTLAALPFLCSNFSEF